MVPTNDLSTAVWTGTLSLERRSPREPCDLPRAYDGGDAGDDLVMVILRMVRMVRIPFVNRTASFSAST